MATSKLQRRTSELLSIFLGDCTIRENYRPSWLVTDNGGYLELDFYVEEIKAAIEVQGRQHAVFVPIFHKDYNDFKNAQSRDKIKRERCQQRRIDLFEVWSEKEAYRVVETLHFFAFQKRKIESWQHSPLCRLWKEYPTTISRHLRLLQKILDKASRNNTSNDKAIAKIALHLRAIEDYQDAKGRVGFCSNATALLNVAQLISNS